MVYIQVGELDNVETLGSSMSEHLSSIGFLPRRYDNDHPTG